MSDAATAAANRRGSPRKKPKNSTKFGCVPNAHGLGQNVAVSILDVSETGVRMVLKAPARIGQEIEVALEAPGDRRTTKIVAQVVWCVETADGQYCVGAHFTKPISYGSLQALVYM